MPNNFFVMLWCVFLCAVAIKVMSFRRFSFLDSVDTRTKNSIDALRCYLALGVVFHHYMYNFFFHNTGHWTIKGFNFNSFIGGFAVSIFFMISGYLFSSIERKKTKWWLSFFTKRLFRVAPMCFFSSILCVVIAFLYRNENWHFSLLDTLAWFDAGIFNHRPDLFGLDKSALINSGVTWTLQWEWMLYFCLPVISLLIKNKHKLKFSVVFCTITLLLAGLLKVKGIHSLINPICLFCFSFGFFCKYYRSEFFYKLSNNTFVGVVIFSLILIMAIVGVSASGVMVIIPAFLFLMICNGFTVFGLLKIKGALRIGEISYSIYLIHGIAWYILFKSYPNGEYTLLLSTIVFFLTISVCILTFVYIEFPVYKYGKKLANKVMEQPSISTKISREFT